MTMGLSTARSSPFDHTPGSILRKIAARCRGACKKRPGSRLFVAVLMVGTMCALLSPASGRAEEETGSIYFKPRYFPGTKSYYELVPAVKGDWSHDGDWNYIPAPGSQKDEYVPGSFYIHWHVAKAKARMRKFKNTNGRLAVVKSRELHEFLKTFKPNDITWIGLRYWCGVNKLQWVTGEYLTRRQFSAWDRIWNRGAVRPSESNARHSECLRNRPYWPVHYWGVDDGFRWNAQGPVKAGTGYFVEYPTGKE